MLTVTIYNFVFVFHTNCVSIITEEQEIDVFMKRKVKQNAAVNHNKTPKESLPDAEFAAEYEGENVAKYANRNSKKGKQK